MSVQNLNEFRIHFSLPEFRYERLEVKKSLFVGIFNICRGVSYIIRRLQDKGERISAPFRPGFLLYAGEQFFLGAKVSHLFFGHILRPGIHFNGRPRILYHRGKQPVCEIQTAAVLSIVKLRHETQSLCIALEIQEVFFLLKCQDIRDSTAVVAEPRKMPCEPFAYRFLTEMAERRIPNVMDETGTFYDSRNISLCLEVERRIQPSVNDGFRNILGKRSAD